MKGIIKKIGIVFGIVSLTAFSLYVTSRNQYWGDRTNAGVVNIDGFSGTGTAENPFQIQTAEDLIKLQLVINSGGLLNGQKVALLENHGEPAGEAASGVTETVYNTYYYYQLMADIDVRKPVIIEGQNDNQPIAFVGIGVLAATPFMAAQFDGQGYTIYCDNVPALFPYVDVKPYAYTYSSIKQNQSWTWSATPSKTEYDAVTYTQPFMIKNLNVNMTGASSDIVGGIIGQASNINMNHCSVSGSITGSKYVGGIIGNVVKDAKNASKVFTVDNCKNFASITGEEGAANVGGIIGNTANPTLLTVSNCLNAGILSGGTKNGEILGYATANIALLPTILAMADSENNPHDIANILQNGCGSPSLKYYTYKKDATSFSVTFADASNIEVYLDNQLATNVTIVENTVTVTFELAAQRIAFVTKNTSGMHNTAFVVTIQDTKIPQMYLNYNHQNILLDGSTNIILTQQYAQLINYQIQVATISPTVTLTLQVNGQQPFIAESNQNYSYPVQYEALSLIITAKRGDDVSTFEVSVTFENPVAKIGNQLYYMIEDAIAAAVSGDMIVLLDNTAFTTDLDRLNPNIVDKRAAYIIKAGVTLLVPYAADDYGDSEIYVSTQTPVGKPYKTLTIPEGIHFTIQGTVKANAKIGNVTTTTMGSICGNYGKIISEGTIEVASGGLLESNGIVTGSGTITARDGGKVYDVLTTLGFRGGKYSNKVYGTIFPFQEYKFCNVENRLILEYGSSYYGKYYVYTTAISGNGLLKVVSDETDALFQLKSGYIEKSLLEETVIKAGKEIHSQRMIMNIYGDMLTNPIKLDLSGASFSTADKYFPVNGNMTLNLKSGTTTVTNMFKFLPGSQVNIDSEATLHIASSGKILFYEQSPDFQKHPETGVATGIPTPYSTNSPYAEIPSKLTVNGKLKIDGTFGGEIFTTATTGIIEIADSAVLQNITSQEVATWDGSSLLGSVTFTSYTFQATGVLVGANLDSQPLQQYTYYSNGEKWYNYTVSYYKEGVLWGDNTQYVAHGDAVSLASYSESGYDFFWNTAIDGTGTEYNLGASLAITADIDLYLQKRLAKATVAITGIPNVPIPSENFQSFELSATPSHSLMTVQYQYDWYLDGEWMSDAQTITVEQLTIGVHAYKLVITTTLVEQTQKFRSTTGDESHLSVTEKRFTIEFTGHATTITAEDVAVDYDTQPHGIIATTNSDGAIEYLYQGTLYNGSAYESNEAPVMAGNFTVTITVPATLIYEHAEKTVSLVIHAIEITGITFESQSFVYDKTAKSLSVVGARDTDIVTYTGNGMINANTYEVSVTIERDNYTPLTLTAELKIAHRNIDIAADHIEVIYNGALTDQTLTYQVGTGLLAGDRIQGMLSREVGNVPNHPYQIMLGTVNVYDDATNAINENYAIQFTGDTYTILPKMLTAAVTYERYSYDGTSKMGTIEVTGYVLGDIINSYKVVIYQVTEANGSEVLTEVSAAVNAGMYKIQLISEDSHYIMGELTVEQAYFEIAKAVLTVSLASTSSIYHGSAVDLAFNNHLHVAVEYVITNIYYQDSTVTTIINAGEYQVSYTVVADNYQGSGELVYTVAKADYENIVHPGVTMIYHPGLTLSEFILNDQFIWNDANMLVSVVNSGDSFAATFVSNDENYNDYALNITITVEKAMLAVDELSFISQAKVYNGQEQSIKATGRLPEGVILAYEGKGTIVGTYLITLTMNYDDVNYNLSRDGVVVSNTMTAHLEITKATYQDIEHQPVSITYHPGLLIGEIALLPNFTWQNQDTPLVVKMSNQTFVAVYNADTHNYNDALVEVIVVIEKATITDAIILNGYQDMYDGASHSLSVSGELPVGVLSIIYSDNNALLNVGKEVVTVSFVVDENYYELAPLEASLEILPRIIEVTPNEFGHIYGAADALLEQMILTGIGQEVLWVGFTREQGINAGLYDIVSVVMKEINNNYTVSLLENAGFEKYTIAKASVNAFDFIDQTYIYDGKEKTLSIADLPQGIVNVEYSANARTNVGRLQVAATFTVDDNYHPVANKVATLTIMMADYEDITFPEAQSMPYGTLLEDIGLTFASNEYGYFAWLNGSVMPKLGTTKYQLMFIPDNENYNKISMEIAVTIVQKELTLQGDVQKEYDGTNLIHSLLALMGIVDDELVSFRATYSDIHAGDNVLLNVQLTGIDSGNYMIKDSYYGVITPRTLEIDYQGETEFVYHGKIQTNIIFPIFQNVLPTDTISYVYKFNNEMIEKENFINAGYYQLEIVLPNGDYRVDGELTSNITIAKKTITVTPNHQRIIYGTRDIVLDYTASEALYGTDQWTGQLAKQDGVHVGSYNILIGTLSAGSNYEVILEAETVDIIPREINFTYDRLSFVYNGQMQKVQVTTNDILGIDLDKAVYQVAYMGDVTNAGTYEVQIASVNADYVIALANVSKTIAINKADKTSVITLDELESVYTGSNILITAHTDGLAYIVTAKQNDMIVDLLNAGIYTVVITIDEQNYQGSKTFTYTVKKASRMVTLDDVLQNVTADIFQIQLHIKDYVQISFDQINWTPNALLTGLTSDTEYKIYLYIPEDANHFTSNIVSITIRTNVDPAEIIQMIAELKNASIEEFYTRYRQLQDKLSRYHGTGVSDEILAEKDVALVKYNEYVKQVQQEADFAQNFIPNPRAQFNWWIIIGVVAGLGIIILLVASVIRKKRMKGARYENYKEV